MRTAERSAAWGTALALCALLAAAPRPGEALRQLHAAGTATEPTAPLVAAVALLAWALALWLLVTVGLTLLARHEGAAGRLAGTVARRVAPLAVRRAVEVALGLTVVVGGGTTHALAAPGGPVLPAAPAAAAAASLDWAGTPAPDLDWPSPDAGPATSVRAAPLPAAEPQVVVQPGDTLWGLAERSLARQQGAAPSTGQVAAAWPTWWQANRDAVGEDPDLLLPGTALSPPVAAPTTAPAAPTAAPPA